MKKIGKFLWAFFAMMTIFLGVGLSTLGSGKTAGDSMTYFANKSAVYEFVSGSRSVKSVYVNVGTVYTEVGDSVKLEVQGSNSSTLASATDIASPFYMSNVYSSTGRDGYNYNWQAFENSGSVSSKYLVFKASGNLQLREIVAFDADGARIEMKPYFTNKDFSVEERLKAVDAQKDWSLEDLQSQSYRNSFTQSEALTMTAVNTLRAEQYSGFKYSLDGSFGIFSAALIGVGVAVFGESTFAVRFVPFIATAAAIVFLFLLCKELFKSEKHAFFASLLFAAGGIATTVGRIGAPYAMVASALIASVYFAYRFFAKGISSKRPVRSGMNVFASGIFAALAIVMETVSILPVAGVLVLIGFGVKRIGLAKAVALKKLGVEDEEAELDPAVKTKVTAVQAEYAYKKRVTLGLTILSFGAITFLLALLVGSMFYKPLVLVYDNDGEHSKGFLSLLFANATAFAKMKNPMPALSEGSTSVFSWLLPYPSVWAYAWNAEVGIAAAMNKGVTALALGALLVATFKVAHGFVQKASDKTSLRIRRIYFLLLSAMAASMLAASVKGTPTLLSAMLFSAAYLSFLPLAAVCVEGSACRFKQLASNFILYGSAAIAVSFFLLSAVFGLI